MDNTDFIPSILGRRYGVRSFNRRSMLFVAGAIIPSVPPYGSLETVLRNCPGGLIVLAVVLVQYQLCLGSPD
jgi:hypothetical protein